MKFFDLRYERVGISKMHAEFVILKIKKRPVGRQVKMAFV
jgi:hypothetical protein